MASSVYSERAFSSSGITLTKRWNPGLKGDVVEALQILKAEYREAGHIFREQPSMKMEEKLMNEIDNETEALDLDLDCEEDS